jgi:hypothetical protein
MTTQGADDHFLDASEGCCAYSQTPATASSQGARVRRAKHLLAFFARNSHRLWLSSRALVLNNGGSYDLWLSATGAVLNGGRWLHTIKSE